MITPAHAENRTRLTSCFHPFVMLPMDAARRQQLLSFLQRIGLEPPEAALSASALAPLDEALTHTSAGLAVNHERLEFLGDAVLRLAASEFLEMEQSSLSVGARSALRAQLVSDRWLAELGDHCAIDTVLRIGAVAAGDRTGRATLRAEACEAVIGALYCDGGLDAARAFIHAFWAGNLAGPSAPPKDPKSALQEWAMAQGLGLPAYTVVATEGPAHDPLFTIRLSLAGLEPEEAEGKSRKLAERRAAGALLRRLQKAGRI